MTPVLVPISYGELLDKITILRIKSERIGDRGKLRNIRRELQLLEDIRAGSISADAVDTEIEKLKKTNEALWDIEDRIRMKEHLRQFDEEFIQLARSVYMKNDERAGIKRRINEKLGSSIREEKSYTDYRTR